MESIFYSSTRQLKILGVIVLLAGILAGIMTTLRGWPTDDVKAAYYGLYMTIGYIEFIASFTLSLLEKAEALRKKERESASASHGDYTITSESGADAEIDALILSRYEAKKAKNFAEADRIRNELKERGIEITDVPGGAVWKRV